MLHTKTAMKYKNVHFLTAFVRCTVWLNILLWHVRHCTVYQVFF